MLSEQKRGHPLTQESTIQLSAEGGFTPLDMSSEAVEVDNILHNTLVFTHAEIFEVGLCFAFGVVWSEVFS